LRQQVGGAVYHPGDLEGIIKSLQALMQVENWDN
jgi:hypothetical protein